MYLADKQVIRKRFQNNFSTYNKQAMVQKQIASRLVQQLVKTEKPSFKRIVEIGCGTGFLTDKILANCKVQEYIINDLTTSVLDVIHNLGTKNNFRDFIYAPGDAETIEFPNQLDAIFSTSTFQWFHNFEFFLHRAIDLLNNGGMFSFSTFGEENFGEIRALLDIGLNYKTLNELVELLEPKFDILYAYQWKQQEVFKSPHEVLKHIKHTGVNGVQKTFLGREKLIRFEEEYVRHYSNAANEVHLTYHPIIIIARKR